MGIVASLLAAMVIRYFVKTDELSVLAIQLPDYRLPQMRQVLIVVYEKVKVFCFEAGKIILLISIILWFCRPVFFLER